MVNPNSPAAQTLTTGKPDLTEGRNFNREFSYAIDKKQNYYFWFTLGSATDPKVSKNL
jgi:hypothetical protein